PAGAICPAHTSPSESAGGRAVASPTRQLLAWAAEHPQARFALLTPAHQSPLGVALSLPRRASCWRGP
ncbi:hypothetical protein EVV80_28800, partial [Klebsiella pneumoniae]